MNINRWSEGHIPAQIVDVDLWENDASLVAYDHKIYFQFSGTNPNMEDAINFIVNELDILEELRAKLMDPEASIKDVHEWIFRRD